MCIFFFNDTATTEIYTLSLHDALPIFWLADALALTGRGEEARDLFERLLDLRNDVGLLSEEWDPHARRHLDRKSTRLNSSHANISYAVFCLKKKNKM